MLNEIDLRALSELHSPERAFLSLYFEDEAGRNMLQQRIRRCRDLVEDDADELEHFERNLEKIESWLEEHESADGPHCVFACWLLDLCQGYALDLPAGNRLRVGAAPYLRPLAELQEENETFAMVVIDNEATRVFLVTAEESMLEDTVRGDVRHRTKKGGWSQKRYARRREKQLHHYVQEVADHLGELVRDEGIERIVLLGSEETRVALLDRLTPEVRECLIGERGIDVEAARDWMTQEALELFFEDERQSETRTWKEIRAEYLGEGLATVGAEDVWRMLAVGRVDRVLLDRELECQGTRCSKCGNVTPREADRCDFCEGDDVFPVDLIDEIVRQAEQTSAEIDFADPIPGLTKVGGIAALLRY
ncbi:MAG: Vms1/Ankzf1 family peptidyl-tRNA hydrolase [Planctomycetota bacterium]